LAGAHGTSVVAVAIDNDGRARHFDLHPAEGRGRSAENLTSSPWRSRT
jgi:hypothetical protein